MKIREVNQKDVSDLAKLAQETYKYTFGQTMSKKSLEKALKERDKNYFRRAIESDTILVAELNNILVGFIQIGEVSYKNIVTTGNDLELKKIYIDSYQQGKGIGKELMKAMFKHPCMQQAKNIYLDVFAENVKAIGLYKKFGFTSIGKIPFKVDGKIVGYDLLMKCSI